MDIRDRLRFNMRRLRHLKGWSQEEFAHQAGLHRTYVSDLERGARNPTIEVIDKLAVALGVPVGALLDDENSEET
jgi:transcriptional regulator with XRE-family HTH domain